MIRESRFDSLLMNLGNQGLCGYGQDSLKRMRGSTTYDLSLPRGCFRDRLGLSNQSLGGRPRLLLHSMH